MHKCGCTLIHAHIQSPSPLLTVYPDDNPLQMQTIKIRKRTITRSFQQQKIHRMRVSRGKEEEERRWSTKRITFPRERAPEKARSSIFLLLVTERASGNVLGERYHVETENDVDLVQTCAPEDETQMLRDSVWTSNDIDRTIRQVVEGEEASERMVGGRGILEDCKLYEITLMMPTLERMSGDNMS